MSIHSILHLKFLLLVFTLERKIPLSQRVHSVPHIFVWKSRGSASLLFLCGKIKGTHSFTLLTPSHPSHPSLLHSFNSTPPPRSGSPTPTVTSKWRQRKNSLPSSKVFVSLLTPATILSSLHMIRPLFSTCSECLSLSWRSVDMTTASIPAWKRT